MDVNRQEHLGAQSDPLRRELPEQDSVVAAQAAWAAAAAVAAAAELVSGC